MSTTILPSITRPTKSVSPYPRRTASALDSLVRALAEGYQPELIVLFGSLAWGEPHPDSDIDLLIVAESAETPLERRIRARRLAAHTHDRIPFAPLVLTPDELQQRLAMNDPFYHKILEQGERLYERA